MARAVKTAAGVTAEAPPAKRRVRLRWTTEVARLFPRQGEWTEAAYLALPDANRVVELSEGRLVIPDMPTDPHQFAVGEMFAAIRAFVREHDRGHVRMAPLRVRLWPGKFREPDVVFLSRQHEERRGREFWGVPDLVVEVISPRTEHSNGTERTDRVEKLQEYALAGILEYWLVDLKARTIEVHLLREELYHLLGKWEMGEVARSEVLEGFEIPVAAVMPEEG
jgi:Uma2 family endonuclease